MNKLFVSVHLENKSNEILVIENLDFKQYDVSDLKKKIAEKLNNSNNNDLEKFELIYNGAVVLQDENKLDEVVKPNGMIKCFPKTKEYEPYKPTEDFTATKTVEKIENLFNSIAHIQISVNSRVNILQKILAEFPEFRRNLGAQALIRDSVLFNTLHQKHVIQNIAVNYPIICEASGFIIETIKKELRDANNLIYRETTAESPNSSEEENSLGASSSNNSLSDNASTQTEDSRIRAITRQQLESALAQVTRSNMNSVNSLSNIAQRNTDTDSTSVSGPPGVVSTPSHALSTSASGERISQEMFRHELARVLNTLVGSQPSGSSASQRQRPANQDPPQQMDTSDDSSAREEDGDIPLSYRNHQYASQLRQMAAMGFTNFAENITYLDMTNGNIENAINLLMAAMN